jgi:hypothetical protein
MDVNRYWFDFLIQLQHYGIILFLEDNINKSIFFNIGS